MSLRDGLPARPVTTFVVRLWPVGPADPSRFRYQVNHVQTGRVAYFEQMEDLIRHFDALGRHAPAADHGPIDFLSYASARERQNTESARSR